MWTALQAPSLNIPGFAGEVRVSIHALETSSDLGQNGMPIGLSLVSGRYKDQQLVVVAKEIAKVFKGAHGGRIRNLPGVPEALL
jgi:Asp-tRNA(Asn)/Glu-tRNA(Gln) amidotransferase A subunit family amidase